jgi:histidine triad (HIT) family protein
MNPTCIFCKIIAGQIPAKLVAKTDDLIVIQDIVPKAPIHYLIIPLKHTTDISSLNEADMGIMASLGRMAQSLASALPGDKAFRLVINNGAQSGQSVFHLHAHFLSGRSMHDL